jgi:hypothetical protein
MNTERERVISISLTEAEWQAFVARHPKPVDWLRERILNEVAAGGMDVTDRTSAGLGGLKLS